MQNSSASQLPWVSFCVATYRRQAFLQETLAEILKQEVDDFEIIVSDNDPEASSRAVVDSFHDSRLRYLANQNNVGMVKNFNKALSHARGEYVVMICDDDPIYPSMLSTLRGLVEEYPGYGAYYGAPAIRITQAEVAQLYGRQIGDMVGLSSLTAENGVRCYTADSFPLEFFTYRVYPYFLWSTGIVKRSIALEMGGMPDFGSPYFTDFGYIVLAGCNSGCVTINKALGVQTIHSANFGRREYAELNDAVHGAYGYLAERMSQRQDWQQVRPALEKFLGGWMVGHLMFLRSYFSGNPHELKNLDAEARRIFQRPYLRHAYPKYLLRAHSPVVYRWYLWVRQRLGTIGKAVN